MNIVNLIGAPVAAPLNVTAGSTLSGGAATAPATTSSGTAPTSDRDSQISDLATISSSVNLLGQAASSQSASADEPLLNLPALPAMPAPTPAPPVASDDHGQSNIVFSDPDTDGDLIH
jgi:hypothetical protein